MTIAVVVCAVILFVTIVWLADLAFRPRAGQPRARRAPGRHAIGGPRAEAETPQDEADPFADRSDEDPDEYIAAIRDPEPEPETRPDPVLAAPVPADLEPLPSSPLDRRERTAIPAGALPAWEPPVSRGTLESFRDALRAWNPAPAGPQPEAGPEPERAEPDWLTTSAVNAFAPVMELGDVGRYVDREFAPAEEAVRALIAEHLGNDEKAAFAGVSVAGLPDGGWSLDEPVPLNGDAGRHSGGSEAA